MQRIGQELLHRAQGQRAQLQIVDGAAAAYLVQRQAQRVAGLDFIAAVGADEHQARQIARAAKPTDEVQGSGIAELQVIEKYHQRLLGRHHTDEIDEHDLKAVLRLGGRQFGHGGLLPEEWFKLRREVKQQLCIRRQSHEQARAPGLRFGFGLGQQLPRQATQSQRQGGIRRATLELVELALHEQTAVAHQRFVDLVDQRRFAHARKTRHHANDGIACRHLLEQGQQCA